MNIELNQLTFKREQHVILNQVDWLFQTGTLTLLTGDSGSGKSTLLRLMTQYLPLSYQGTIHLGTEEVRELSIQEKAKRLGMMFQKPNRQFTMATLRRELIFALENLDLRPVEIRERMAYALEFGETNHLLEQSLTTLSGGEKQRAALTILVAMDPDIYLLDEPFASIDPKSRQRLLAKLVELKKLGKTLIIIDHDLSDYAQLADDWVHLKDGQLIRREREGLIQEKESLLLGTQTEVGSSLITFENFKLHQNKRLLIDAPTELLTTGITTLTGENGTGKTSLLRAMVQQKKYQGTLRFEEVKLRKNRWLYQKLSLAVQEAEKQFLTLTLQEELSFDQSKLSPKQQVKQKEALEFLGLDRYLKQSLFHLSEGQKKMVQLITMLSLDLKLLLLDEPFAGLDERACRYFMEWIDEKKAEQSFVVVSHRLSPLINHSDYHLQLAEQALTYQFMEVEKDD
ncbi:ABC transporter ATP-binding protein [Vagococcus sp.]|uniref:ABC transporter ATP-binding protein n=1 Tax=Vagococcus sp. TaxID=1933889 RepID=UPI003F94F3E9